MNYDDAVAYLTRFINYELTPAGSAGAPAWDLDGFRLFLADLGSPERRFPSILIAGTKGKGSVATLVAGALRASGLRVGLYTSPHLTSLRERIVVDGALISPEEFAACIVAVSPSLDGRPGIAPCYRTWFEIVTAAAFLHFGAARVDIAVLEVGLGGRLDATNVVEPLVSVITSISLDHTHTLGATLGAIAIEKAGILRPGVPAVTAPQRREAHRAIIAEARRRGAVLHEPPRDFSWEEREVDRGGSVFDYRGARSLDAVHVALPGTFQVQNAAVAMKAIELLGGAGFPVSDDAVRGAFASARWAGRFEEIAGAPLILLDGAHNPYSIEEMLASVERIYPGRRIVALFAASRDKDQRGMLAALHARAAHILLTEAPNTRNAPVGALLAVAEGVSATPPREAIPSPADALERAREIARDGDLILVTGSLYLVGVVRELLRREGRLAPESALPVSKTG